MNVTTELTKVDLIKANLIAVLRSKATCIQILVLLVLAFFMSMSSGFPQTENAWLVTLMVFMLLSITALILTVIFTILYLFFSFSFSRSRYIGVLGEHYFKIDESGLVEKTTVNESMHAWKSISKVYVLFGYLFIFIGNRQLHLIPKKSFSSINEFKKCVGKVKHFSKK